MEITHFIYSQLSTLIGAMGVVALLDILFLKFLLPKEAYDEFFAFVTRLVCWAGIALIVNNTVNFLLSTDDFARNRAFGPYAFSYWLMFLGPFLITQLFWLAWVRKKRWVRNILGLLLLSITKVEIFVIMISSMHRDYVPSSSGQESYLPDVAYFICGAAIVLTGVLYFRYFKSGKRG